MDGHQGSADWQLLTEKNLQTKKTNPKPQTLQYQKAQPTTETHCSKALVKTSFIFFIFSGCRELHRAVCNHIHINDYKEETAAIQSWKS